MDGLLKDLRFYLEQAERTLELARKEPGRKRRALMMSIADHLYMLHDQLVELSKLENLPSAGALFRRASL